VAAIVPDAVVDGGWFACQVTYGLFPIQDRHASKSENTSEALQIELMGDLRGHSKEELRQILD
jgi:hypothetical protein